MTTAQSLTTTLQSRIAQAIAAAGGWIGFDRFMALADFGSYVDAQERVDVAYADLDAWVRSAILNVARSGFFSSDRAMRDYLDRIWMPKS